MQGLFFTHQRGERIERHFERLRVETQSLVDWHFVFNGGDGVSPTVDWSYRPASVDMPLRYQNFVSHGGVMGGYMDVAIIPLVVSCQGDFVWVMEYDVDYSGNWMEFFKQFQSNVADLLTTSLVDYQGSRDWFYWPTAQTPADVTSTRWHRAFHPIMRLSRKFAEWYRDEMAQRNWRGHYEFTLPTAALWAGFQVEDIGGDGAFCPPERLRRNYSNNPPDENLAPGTFVFRPARTAYFHESPGDFALSHQLYHPVKPDVPLWSLPEPPFMTRCWRWAKRWLLREEHHR